MAETKTKSRPRSTKPKTVVVSAATLETLAGTLSSSRHYVFEELMKVTGKKDDDSVKQAAFYRGRLAEIEAATAEFEAAFGAAREAKQGVEVVRSKVAKRCPNCGVQEPECDACGECNGCCSCSDSDAEG